MSEREITVIVDETTGALSLEGLDWDEAHELLGDDLGEPTSFNCAVPLPEQVVEINQPDQTVPETSLSVRVHRIYAGAVAEGPGRRVVVQLQGCKILCKGCYVPQTHSESGGTEYPLSQVLSQVLALLPEHNGVSIVGGEPFAQPEALAGLVGWFHDQGIHTVVYSGYPLMRLLGMANETPSIRSVLEQCSVLIDGPYVASLAGGAGEYMGSRNQRYREHDEIIEFMAQYERAGARATLARMPVVMLPPALSEELQEAWS